MIFAQGSLFLLHLIATKSDDDGCRSVDLFSDDRRSDAPNRGSFLIASLF
jgi:hypothetical protein